VSREIGPPRAGRVEPRRDRDPGGATPVISVVVLSYNSRERIGASLESLRAQDIDEPYEVIVVDSGRDGCAAHVRARYPEVRLVRAESRLLPGGARNRGVEAARGRYVAFLADDCAARPDWLRRRVAKHRQGFSAVGGAVTNGTPWHPVGSAHYLVEYAGLIPSGSTLARPRIPYSLSYEGALFERLGHFPEDTQAGEDSVFNTRCVAAGVRMGFDAGVQISHRSVTRLGSYLRHQYRHGRALVQCVERHGLPSRIGRAEQPLVAGLCRIFLLFPAWRWLDGLKRVAYGRPPLALAYLAFGPLIWAGYWARSAGAWSESRSVRRSGAREGSASGREPTPD
jgi:glycosyltransferase involved in cell wall biosynthesis